MTHNQGYTLDNYRRLLITLKSEGYTFSPYVDQLPDERTVLLRHDIDYTLTYAKIFAEINAEEGVQGTFFLQLRSGLYNLFDTEVLAAIDAIRECKQFFGFHMVVDDTWDSLDGLRQCVDRDFKVFKSLIPDTHPVFAWHNPGTLVQEGFNHIKASFNGLMNAYADFTSKDIPYFADSNMRYSFEELLEIVRQGTPAMQLAIAPMQWCPEADDMPQVMIANFVRKLRDLEAGFMENNVYSRLFPNRLPKDVNKGMLALLTNAARKQ